MYFLAKCTQEIESPPVQTCGEVQWSVPVVFVRYDQSSDCSHLTYFSFSLQLPPSAFTFSFHLQFPPSASTFSFHLQLLPSDKSFSFRFQPSVLARYRGNSKLDCRCIKSVKKCCSFFWGEASDWNTQHVVTGVRIPHRRDLLIITLKVSQTQK